MGTCLSNLLFSPPTFQQTHQKNQLKDTIDVDEPEGMLSKLLPVAFLCCLLYHFANDQLHIWHLETGDPLTPEELEEKERLLEEVNCVFRNG